MGIDLLTIPTQEAILALDLAAALSRNGESQSVALNDSPLHQRIKTLFVLNQVKGKFASTVLDLALDEGKRQMYSRQPYYVRSAATRNESDLSSVISLEEE